MEEQQPILTRMDRIVARLRQMNGEVNRLQRGKIVIDFRGVSTHIKLTKVFEEESGSDLEPISSDN